MKTNPNEPMNPTTFEHSSVRSTGLSKREHFATLAMQGVLASPETITTFLKEQRISDLNMQPSECIAKYAVIQADALIKALNEESK